MPLMERSCDDGVSNDVNNSGGYCHLIFFGHSEEHRRKKKGDDLWGTKEDVYIRCRKKGVAAEEEVLKVVKRYHEREGGYG